MRFEPIAALGATFASLGLTDADCILDPEGDDVDESSERGWYVAAVDQTWELHIDKAQVVESVTLFPRRFYALQLPLNATQGFVRLRFGSPTKSAREPGLANIADRYCDMYRVGGIRYRFEYKAPLMTLSLVELSVARA